MNGIYDVPVCLVAHGPLCCAMCRDILHESSGIQPLKLTTPASVADYFYFNVDFRDMMSKLNDECDEIIGFSIGRLYIGLYNNCIQWGILDENGAL
jgi:hypothetical protein